VFLPGIVAASVRSVGEDGHDGRMFASETFNVGKRKLHEARGLDRGHDDLWDGPPSMDGHRQCLRVDAAFGSSKPPTACVEGRTNTSIAVTVVAPMFRKP
jgi:hypothetical protein